MVYQDKLRVILTEGFVGNENETEDLCIGDHTIKGVRLIDISDESRLFVVRFPEIVAWQVVDESFTSFDEYEQRDDNGVLQSLVRSKYLDYVKSNHGWFEDAIGPAKHYRVWTENEVVDVIACEPPTVEPWVRT
ncbi:MAG: hypothetical protein ACFB0C_14335 [Leptolyngbyaceae cyanobacterium]